MSRIALVLTFVGLIAIIATADAAGGFNETCTADAQCLTNGACTNGKCICKTGYISILPTFKDVNRPITCMIILKRGDSGCIEPRQCKRSTCYNGVCH